MNNNYQYTKECIRGSKPPCTCGCPINFDIKKFLKKIQTGNYNGAYRNMAEQLLFPDIVALICDGFCTDKCESKININSLERICVSNASIRKPNYYRIPAKKEKIAVIGAGLCGLSCTLKLASKRYDVTVFEKTDKIGGTLYNYMDPAVFQNDFELQFQNAPYNLILNSEITSIDNLCEEFDAVFIATGNGGLYFDVDHDFDPMSMATGRDGVFLGGSLKNGHLKIKSIADGIVAAASIERFIQTGSMKGQPETFIQNESKFDSFVPSDCEKFYPPDSPDYARKESMKCLMCDCTKCMDNCEFMKHLNMYPQEIETNVINARLTSQGLIERVGSRMIFSCSVCGKCGTICPESISLEDLLLESKIMLFNDKKYPETLHDFFIRDMNDAMGKNYLAVSGIAKENSDMAERNSGEAKDNSSDSPTCNSRFMLFPGCQTAESSPEYIKASFDYMKSTFSDSSMIMGCCGIPALWAGNISLFKSTLSKIKNDWLKLGSPTIVSLCPSCIKTFQRYLPECKVTSFYEFLSENGLPENRNNYIKTDFKKVYSIFDPCSSRDHPQLQDAIRDLLIKSHLHIEESPDSREKPSCCGNGGHIYPANSEIVDSMIDNSVNSSSLPLIAYCANCRNLFVSKGKECFHILDIIFDLEPLKKTPHISDLRRNRTSLIEDLRETYASYIVSEDLTRDISSPYFSPGDVSAENECSSDKSEETKIKIIFPEEVLNEMDRNLISEDDIREVIVSGENGRRAVISCEDNSYVSCKQIGLITYWVRYSRIERPDNGSFSYQVKKAYSHRITIEK